MLIFYTVLIIFVLLQLIFIQLFIKSFKANKKIQMALTENKGKYKSLFENMQEGFALHEIICDDAGKPIDSRFLDVNKAFENITGLKRGEIINKTLLEILPETEVYWIEKFGEVALNGKDTHFEDYSKEMEGYYSVNVFCPEKGKCAVIFFNITENKIRQEELICTTKQLTALNTLKDKLFTTVAHDIRNPMATMVSMMEVLEEDYYCSDSREIVHEVKKQVKDTFFMVENLLELLNSPQNGLVNSYISKIAQETVNALQNITEAEDIRIINNIEDSVTIFVDRETLGMVLQSLFNNALKFSRSGGLISVQTQQTGQKVIVIVRDTGISIDSEEAKTLFNEAYLGSTADTMGEKETGWGILICKEFVQCNEGEIWMEGIVLKGSTFYFSLPSEHKVNCV